jgi:hypothetical protein
LAATVSLVTFAGATSAASGDSFTGNGCIGSDCFRLQARSGANGEHPSGTVTLDANFVSQATGVSVHRTLAGNVSGGCLRIFAGTAVAIGKLAQPQFGPTGNEFDYVGVVGFENFDPPNHNVRDAVSVVAIPAQFEPLFCDFTGFFTVPLTYAELGPGAITIVDN